VSVTSSAVPVRYEPALTEAEELTLLWRIVDESLELARPNW
jgi:hypothetical protein